MGKFYMCDGSYDKNVTKYTLLKTFYVLKEHAESIFTQLYNSNRITTKSNNFYNLYNPDKIDKIFIRALYYIDSTDPGIIHLLVCNDARRKIMSLYNDRIEHNSFWTQKLYPRLLRVFQSRMIEKFIEVAKNSQCFIAGSYPLQIYLDKYWTDSDIDIFCPSNKGFQSFRDFFRNELYLHEQIISKTTTTSNKDAQLSLYHRFDVIEYNFFGQRIQLINILNSNISSNPQITSFISSFDLDFCKIAWHFDSHELIINNLNSIKTMSCCVNKNVKKHPKFTERVQKYNGRGFKIYEI